MTLEAYKVALEQAKKDLASKIAAVGEAEQIVELGTKQIVELRQTIAVLSKLCGEPEYVEEDALGITDVVRMVYKSAVNDGNGFSAQDVRERIESMGYAGRWTNLLASVHTVTNRLFKMGEIQASGNVNGKETFRWKKAASDKALDTLYNRGKTSLLRSPGVASRETVLPRRRRNLPPLDPDKK